MTFASKDDPYRDQKKYHFAAFWSRDGGVSALCFKSQRPINLKVALWTYRKNAVTCAACLRKMREAYK